MAYIILLFVAAWVGALIEYVPAASDDLAKTAVMALIVPTFARRMHDNGRSGWWAAIPALGLVPRVDDAPIISLAELSLLPALVLGLLCLWGLYLLLQVGAGDPDRFGSDPRIL